ncbi:hypothetical protein CCHR01_11257 [Colletotrichum chrysophilum]|uniref:Uncharacterized protein n=1 Tax=Colletotrichum chrysophilum TaxID=1836956 RepID=A0AAD9AG69_9PEZI|nr:hypothetical protein CCHR01_11257 [Colletotrichum chrysophilum]
MMSGAAGPASRPLSSPISESRNIGSIDPSSAEMLVGGEQRQWSACRTGRRSDTWRAFTQS